MPTSHHASAHGLSRATTCSGLASVVKSRSWPSRPSSASRTDAPTSARSWPAAAKRRPSSSTTGATRSSSVIRLRCASDRSARGGTEGAGTGGKGTAREPPSGTTADVPWSGYHRQVTPPPSPRHGDDRRARGGGGRRAGARTGLRKVEETSAGGLVVDRSGERPQVALIGRRDRRGRLLWSLPKGHVESGETAEDAAVRGGEEGAGIRGPGAAQGPRRGGGARRGRRRARGRGGDRHPGPGHGVAGHHRLLVRRREPAHPQDRAPLPARGLGRGAERRGRRGRRGGLGAARRA